MKKENGTKSNTRLKLEEKKKEMDLEFCFCFLCFFLFFGEFVLKLDSSLEEGNGKLRKKWKELGFYIDIRNDERVVDKSMEDGWYVCVGGSVNLTPTPASFLLTFSLQLPYFL